MNESARTFAQQQADLLRQQLASMYDNIGGLKNSETAQAQTRRDGLLQQIGQMRDPINQAYGDNTRQAYINRVQGGNTLQNQLGRLGLSGTGYGVNQMVGLDSSYGNVVSDLQQNRDNALLDVSNKEIDAQNTFNQDLANIDNQYAQRRIDLDQYINGQVQNKYDNTFSQRMNELSFQETQRQNAIANELTRENQKTKEAQQVTEDFDKMVKIGETGKAKVITTVITKNMLINGKAPEGEQIVDILSQYRQQNKINDNELAYLLRYFGFQ